jgi:cytochrome c oxidase subunit 2
MPIVVKVVTKEEYRTWLASQKAGASAPAETTAEPVSDAAPTVAGLPATPRG